MNTIARANKLNVSPQVKCENSFLFRQVARRTLSR